MRFIGGGIRGVLVALVAGLFVLVGAAPASADVDDFEFSSLDVVYELSRDDEGKGVVTVTETFVAEFPEFDQNRGMRRAIPESYLGGPLMPELISVTDENGDPRPAETDSDEGYFHITSRADDYLHGRQTFVITYTLQNVGRAMDNGVDEFYWDVNGEEWPQSFGTVMVDVHVDPDLADEMNGDVACYYGSTGTEQQCTIGTNNATVSSGAVSLGPYETMTIAVGFEPGTFTEYDTSPLASIWGIAQIGTGVLAIVGVVWSIVVRVRHLRDAPGRPTVIPEFEPPEDVDAMRAALLLRRPNTAIPAEILEQAIAGAVTIVEQPARGLFGKPRMVAHLVDPARADGNGRAILAGLFPGLAPGSVFTFGTKNSRFAKHAQRVLKHSRAGMTRWKRPIERGVRTGPAALAFIGLLGGIGFGIAAVSNYVNPLVPVCVGIGSFFLAWVSVMVSSRRPLNEVGAEARDHLRGLEMFMEWAEADRIRMLQSPDGAERSPIDANDPGQVLHLYERLLPYAVVFRMEKKWSEELAVHYQDGSPTWYHGSAAFSAASFSTSMDSLTSGASTASSSGGSGGGGSAGGGGGGGGGGGV